MSEEQLLFSLFSMGEWQERAAKPKETVVLLPVQHHLIAVCSSMDQIKKYITMVKIMLQYCQERQYSSGRTQQKYAKTPNPTANVVFSHFYAEAYMGQLLDSMLIYKKAQTTCSLSIGAYTDLILCLTINCTLLGDLKSLYECKNNFSKISNKKNRGTGNLCD